LGKRGGFFKGYKPHISSSAGAFARRGDPWVTDREGKRDYNRQVEVENPDMDADRQRHARIKEAPKELQDRVKRVDYKMTMQEAIETEKSIRMDSYHQREQQGQRLFKPKFGQWPKRGKDFQVATKQHRLVNVSLRLKNELRAIEGKNTTGIVSGGTVTGLSARTNQEEKIACPRGCGYLTHDSRLVSKHLQKFRNSCCTHTSGCNCPDCRRARNDPM
jgi:hypothetical protein